MSTFKELWLKLTKSKKYREEFVASQVKRGIPFQIRTLMKQKEFSQERLATLSGLTQGVVSRAANPNYGNLTLNTVIRIAAGFDVAFIGRFVPFSELGGWFTNLSEESGKIPTFEEENRAMEQRGPSREAAISSVNDKYDKQPATRMVLDTNVILTKLENAPSDREAVEDLLVQSLREGRSTNQQTAESLTEFSNWHMPLQDHKSGTELFR